MGFAYKYRFECSSFAGINSIFLVMNLLILLRIFFTFATLHGE